MLSGATRTIAFGVFGGRAGGAAIVVGGVGMNSCEGAIVIQFFEEATGPIEIISIGAGGDEMQRRFAEAAASRWRSGDTRLRSLQGEMAAAAPGSLPTPQNSTLKDARAVGASEIGESSQRDDCSIQPSRANSRGEPEPRLPEM